MDRLSCYNPNDIEVIWQSMESRESISIDEISQVEHVKVKHNGRQYHRLPDQEVYSRCEANYDLIRIWENLESASKAKNGDGMYFFLFDKDGYNIRSQTTLGGKRCGASEHITKILHKGIPIEVLFDDESYSPGIRGGNTGWTQSPDSCGPSYGGMVFPIRDNREDLAGFLGVGNFNGPVPDDLKFRGYLGSALLQHKYRALLERKEYVRSILNGLPDYAIILNNDIRIVNANQKFLELLGMDVHSFTRCPSATLSPDDGSRKSNPTFDFNTGNKCAFRTADNGTVSFSIINRHIFQNPQDSDHMLLLLEREARKAYIPVLPRSPFSAISGKSEAIQSVIGQAQGVAKTLANVLIEGETGVGKELIAKAIHQESGRTGFFLTINCGAIPRELLQSELFGYEDGAFTGAKKGGKAGLFEKANGGTIFLDEIGEMPMDMQVSLLRVLQDKAIIRVGGYRRVEIDVRILAATNQNLFEKMKQGNFRADLYYRLNVFYINIPPLRQRKEDIPLIVKECLEKLCRTYCREIPEISAQVMDAFIDHTWDGNVRELRNVIESALITCQNDTICKNDLPLYFKQSAPNLTSEAVTLKEMERAALLQALKKSNGNLSAAANSLGISRPTLYRKMDDCNLDRNSLMSASKKNRN